MPAFGANSARWAAGTFARSSTVRLPPQAGSCARACVAGSSKKSATTSAASLCAALYGIATKLVLPIVPLAITKMRAPGGSNWFAIDTAASAGSKAMWMSIAPSFINWRWAGPVSGNSRPARQSAGRNWSYQAHNGAVTEPKVASVAGCCSTDGSGSRSQRACFRKVAPRKLRTVGCVTRPGCWRANASSAGAEVGMSASLWRALS